MCILVEIINFRFLPPRSTNPRPSTEKMIRNAPKFRLANDMNKNERADYVIPPFRANICGNNDRA